MSGLIAHLQLLLGADAPIDPCPPYTRPNHLFADINLTEALVAVSNTAADTNLCETLI